MWKNYAIILLISKWHRRFVQVAGPVSDSCQDSPLDPGLPANRYRWWVGGQVRAIPPFANADGSYASQPSRASLPAYCSSRLAKCRALARLWAVQASMSWSRASAVSMVDVATWSRGISRSRASART